MIHRGNVQLPAVRQMNRERYERHFVNQLSDVVRHILRRKLLRPGVNGKERKSDVALAKLWLGETLLWGSAAIVIGLVIGLSRQVKTATHETAEMR